MAYTIDSEKLTEVTEIINSDTDPRATEADVETHITDDWPEGQEHQDWIDSADAQEIADWVGVTVYS